MRRWTAWAAPVLLASALFAGNAVAQKGATTSPAQTTPTIADLFAFPMGGNKQPKVASRSVKAGKDIKKAARIMRSDAQQKWELAEYMRRIEVCDKLRHIAELTNDTQLERMVDEFESRVGNLYRRRTTQIPAADNRNAVQRPIAN